MTTSDMAVAEAFVGALVAAAQRGDRDALYALLAPDIEWVTPQRDIVGLDHVRSEVTWLTPPDHLDVEFDDIETQDLGDGRFVSEAVEIYRMKTTGDEAYRRAVRVELAVRDGKVARYERHQA
jgi:ketosteroid isomerase-like protein